MIVQRIQPYRQIFLLFMECIKLEGAVWVPAGFLKAIPVEVWDAE